MTDHDHKPPAPPITVLRGRLRQLILMRETGPKSAAWHRARTRLIWRLHAAMEAQDAAAPDRSPARDDQ